MSYESFGALHLWAGDAEELAGNHRHHVAEMAEWLEAHGYYLPARHTREILRCFYIAEKMSEPLRELWRAVDAHDSWDTAGDDEVKAAAAAYQPWPPEEGR